MTEKELRHLGRRELIEIIAAMKKAEMELQQQLEQAEKQLADRTVKIENIGSIAEAALSLNGVFEAAQSAADSYLESLRVANKDAEMRIAKVEEEETRILQEAEASAALLRQNAEKQCADRLAQTDAEIEQKWAAFQSSVVKVLQSHSELSGYLQE